MLLFSCGERWYDWRRRYRCNTCAAWVQNRVTAIKVKFCKYSDWSKQKTVTYDAGTPQYP